MVLLRFAPLLLIFVHHSEVNKKKYLYFISVYDSLFLKKRIDNKKTLEKHVKIFYCWRMVEE